MTVLLAPVPPATRAGERSGRRSIPHRWLWPAGLAVLVAAAGLVALWGLQHGQRSEYYAAVALSMSEGWRNWLFGALDPGGTISLDKIPGSFWIPALFVRAFGFSTWSVNAPNALATVGAAVITAVAARRLVAACSAGAHGVAAIVAGLLAGFLAAATPIAMAVGRSNQPESFFVLACSLVAWTGVNAVLRRSFGWLVAVGACIALAFQAYMLEAWAAWPALGVAWLLTAGRSGRAWWARGWRLLVAGATSAALSVAWIVVVTLTPAADRPYVGGTYTNSAWEMVFGYNGLGRFSATSASEAYRSFDPPFSGSPGLLRLFNEQVGGQIAWLIPAALVAVIALWTMRRGRTAVVWIGGWLVTLLAMFSAVEGMHQFYTAVIAIPIAILVAAAWARAQELGRLWPRLALLLTAATTAVGLALRTPDYLPWAPIVQLVLAVATAAVITIGWIARRRAAGGRSAARWAGGAWLAIPALLALALTPAAWTLDTVRRPSSLNPVAGDGTAVSGVPGGGGWTGGRFSSADFGASPAFGAAGEPRILEYVEANRGDAAILLATFGAQSAASFITSSGGEPVVPIGGFSGSDPSPTLAQVEAWVASGRLRYVLVSGAPGGAGSGFAAAFGTGRPPGLGGGPATTSEDGVPAQIREWVVRSCATTPITDLYRCGTG